MTDEELARYLKMPLDVVRNFSPPIRRAFERLGLTELGLGALLKHHGRSPLGFFSLEWRRRTFLKILNEDMRVADLQ